MTQTVPTPAAQHRPVVWLCVVWVAAIVLACLHGSLFTVGYRLTADDVFFHALLLDGLPASLDATWKLAVEQGRIGHLAALPMNIAAAYLSDFLWFRLVCVLLHFLSLLLMARYVARLLDRDISVLLFVVLMSLQPLAFAHMPPNAYPLQHAIPFAVILAVRLHLLDIRKHFQRPARDRLPEPLLLAVLGFSMLVDEHCFLLATGLIACELASETVRGRAAGGSLRNSAVTALRSRAARLDLATVAVTLAIYIAFRIWNPTTYPGNSPDGIWNGAAFVRTTLAHMLSGTVLPYIDGSIFDADAPRLLAAALVALVTAALVAWSVPSLASLPSPLLIGLGGLAFAVYVTVPVSMTVKQQAWCIGTLVCPYLDSRTSIYGVGTVVCAMGALALSANADALYRRAARLGVPGLLGALGAVTFLHNARVADDMRGHVSAWERAATLACQPDGIPVSDDRLLALIDPQARIAHHPDFRMAPYWCAYMADRARQAGCTIPSAEAR